MFTSTMATRKTIYVKIGGSTITEKGAKQPKPRMDRIRSFCSEVKQVVSSGTQLILAHGGGSYAHPFAARHGLDAGLTLKNRIGVTETRYWLTELSQIFLREFLRASLPVVVFHPSSLVYKSSSGWTPFLTPIKLALENEITPLLMGDVVFAEDTGVAILSADDIPLLLLDVVDEVLFLVDVPGVMDERGRVLRVVRKKDLVDIGKTSASTIDVTGGMEEKVKKALLLAEKGKKVRIAGYKEKGDLLKALNGLSGTEIILDY